MGMIGKVPEFDSKKEDFDSYLERFERWLSANDIPPGKKADVFLSVLGATEYGLLKNLIAPSKVSDKTYKEITTALSLHFKPKPILIAERFRFYKRQQKTNETVSEYLLALKQLASTCEFGQFLNDALRDQFVCGLSGEEYHKRLLAVKDLTFKKACDIALAHELAMKDTKEMREHVEKPKGEVNKVSNPTSEKWRNKKASNARQSHKGESRAKQHYSREKNQQCYRCGKDNHQANECFYRTETCHGCGKIGHLKRVCKKKQNDKAQMVTANGETDDSDECQGDELGLYTVYTAQGNKDGIFAELELMGKAVKMQVDTGASVSLIPEHIYDEHLKSRPLQPAAIRLSSYTGDTIPVLGKIQVPVKHEGQEWTLPLVVVKGNKTPLLGRNWLRKIKLNWGKIFSLNESKENEHLSLQGVLGKHKELFKEGYGKIKDFKATIRVQSDAKPIFHKPRPVPYALRESVEKELERLQKNGIVTQVERSDWAAPIVVVPKKDKAVRLCGDYKVTVNRCILPEEYPLPNAEDLFATLAGGTVFSKIDLSFAYQQLQLDPESEQYLTINTHKGLFRYHRLAYGVSTAPAVFQHTMDQILHGMDKVVCFMDDILVSAPTKEEHLKILDQVMTRLERYGVRIKQSKCAFLQDSVEYLGYRIDAQGLHPTESKVDAIVNAPAPQNVTELRSFLGLLNYYGKFVANLSTVLHPLHQLLQADTPWKWSTQCEDAFKGCKQRLLNSKCLAHYDPEKPLRLACDASPYGVGAVISHVLPSGEEHPIAFASRTLSPSERNYAQIEKEALSIIFGVKKFHKYLYGRKFVLLTDHKPLLTILGPKSAIPTLAALRMQRWAIILLAYDYDIQYKRSSDHANADALSRLPCQCDTEEGVDDGGVFCVSYVDELPVSATDIATETRHDPILSKVLDLTLSGWPKYVPNPDLQPFHVRKDELSTDQGCVLWGSRVIIPPKYQKRLLSELHDGHPGMTRMKALARSFLWWPGIDQEIEHCVGKCTPCDITQNRPAAAPLHPWSWATSPWERVHVDFAEINKQHYLLLVDVYSKWLEVLPINQTSAEKTSQLLRNLFASYGLPKVLVSDNGPPFTSAEFETFLKNNGIRHILSPPYHPASNGAVERAVQTFKKAWTRLEAQSVSPQHRLAKFLFTYRNTPHTVTERTPAEMFLKRQPRTRLSLLKPDMSAVVAKHQLQQKKAHDKRVKTLRTFSLGERVLVRDFRHPKKLWIPGTILKQRGPLTYDVQVGHRQVKVHVDHLRASKASSWPSGTDSEDATDYAAYPEEQEEETDQQDDAADPPQAVQPARRYPERQRTAPERLSL